MKILLIVAYLILLMPNIFAQALSQVVHVQPSPNNVFLLPVLRGTVVEFQGTIHDTSTSTTFLVREGGQILARQEFFGSRWSLKWDTSKESNSSGRLGVSWLRDNTAEVLMTRYEYTLFEKSPFKVDVSKTSADGHAIIRVLHTSNFQAQSYQLLVDDAPSSVAIDNQGQASLDVSALRPGDHVIRVTANLAAGVEISAEAAYLHIQALVHLLPLDSGNIIDLTTKVSPLIPFRLQIDPAVEPKSLIVMIDNKVQPESIQLSLDKGSFTPNNLSQGKHILTVDVTAKNGTLYQSDSLSLQVLRNPNYERLASLQAKEDDLRDQLKQYDSDYANQTPFRDIYIQIVSVEEEMDSLDPNRRVSDKVQYDAARQECKIWYAALLKFDKHIARTVSASMNYFIGNGYVSAGDTSPYTSEHVSIDSPKFGPQGWRQHDIAAAESLKAIEATQLVREENLIPPKTLPKEQRLKIIADLQIVAAQWGEAVINLQNFIDTVKGKRPLLLKQEQLPPMAWRWEGESTYTYSVPSVTIPPRIMHEAIEEIMWQFSSGKGFTISKPEPELVFRRENRSQMVTITPNNTGLVDGGTMNFIGSYKDFSQDGSWFDIKNKPIK